MKRQNVRRKPREFRKVISFPGHEWKERFTALQGAGVNVSQVIRNVIERELDKEISRLSKA